MPQERNRVDREPAGATSDAFLVMLARDGDRNAFGVLVERYEPLALRVARRAVLDEDVARELVQEALLQAYLSLDRLREEERFRSWLYGIVLNLCRSWQRRRRPLAQSLDDLAGGVRLAGTSEGRGRS